jgi:hypothetical protein
MQTPTPLRCPERFEESWGVAAPLQAELIRSRRALTQPPGRDRAGRKCLAVVRLWLLGIALSAVSAGAAETGLTASLDTTHATLGDPLHLRLIVDRDASARTLFRDLTEQLAPFVVHSASTPRTTNLGQGRQRDERLYELRVYTLDAAQIAAVEVAVVTASGDTIRLLSEAIEITVEAVRDPAEGDRLRDIKPPLMIGGGVPLWLAGIAAVLLTAGIAYLIVRLLRRSPTEILVVPAPRGPVDYVREFARIAEMGLLERGATKLYYTRLAHVMRRFLEDRLGMDAVERTTGEIVADLQVADSVDAESAGRIARFFEVADLVKFARAEPSAEAARRVPDDGADIVRDVENLLRESEAARLLAEPADVGA